MNKKVSSDWHYLYNKNKSAQNSIGVQVLTGGSTLAETTRIRSDPIRLQEN